jgi:subtilase family serine protease
MKDLDFGRFALSVGVGVAMLAGCGGSQPPIGAPDATQQLTRKFTIPVCPQVTGKPTCLTLIESTSGIRPTVAGWTPSDFQARYKLPSITKGSGQIVAIVDAYDNHNVASDLAAYRSEFGLGTANFTKYNQDGQQNNYPSGSTSWGLESDLDVEMVSATCPLCTIYLIEANSANSSDLEAAEVEAVKLGAHIISNSWICYGSLNCVSRRDFNHKGVIYLAAAADGGYGTEGAPADFDTVAAIGGTVLTKSGSRYSETADGSSGGCATGIKKPKWQHDTHCAYRLANDAAAVAWNVAEYDTYGYGGWFTVGGTSVATPLVAGVFGLAGNAIKQDGGRTFWLARHHKFLYPIPGCSGGYGYGQYNTCTGWGSPNGIGAF